MKLLSLQVENFRGIRKAAVEFGAGLNVLYGPNDLGKSSLATAIRAALLMQASSREHEEFLSWHGAADPFVKLVFESEPQRIWRIRKTFGSAGQAFLDESRDGVEFQNVKRGREVDGALSEILQWGLAPPGGGKGRPKGMPMTFLSTALLAEQDRVAAIFERALTDDSDESGKKRLIEALQTIAEDPLYKRVLDKVQARVDEAFTSTGRKSANKDSPWVRIREAIRGKEEEVRQCQEQLQKTESIEAEMRALRDAWLVSKDKVTAEKAAQERIEAEWQRGRQRSEILGRLRQCQEELTKVTSVLRLLDESEKQRSKCRHDVEVFTLRESDARKGVSEAEREALAANEKVARLQSEDRVRERLLERETIQKRCAELGARQARIDASLALVERVRRAALRVSELGVEAGKLDAAVSATRARHERASKAMEDGRRDERDMQSVSYWLRCVDARTKLAGAVAGLAQVETWRAAAREKRVAAASLEASGAGVHLLTSAQLQGLQKLDQELQVARARLDVGVDVSVRANGKLRVSVCGDDGAWVVHELDGSRLETAAHREIALALENIAEIVVSGGSAEARRTALGLQARWVAEVEPVLERAGVVNVAGLARKMDEGAERARQWKEALAEAAQWDQRAADQPDWASLVRERQADLATAAEAIIGLDEAALEKFARSQRVSGAPDVEKRLATLRAEVTKRADVERRISEELARAVAAQLSNTEALASSRVELTEAQRVIDGDWEPALRAFGAERESIDNELKSAQVQLAALVEDDGKALLEAKRLLVLAEAKRAKAEAVLEKSTRELRETEKLLAGIEGQLTLRREEAGKSDQPGARAAVVRVEAELETVPPPALPVTAENLAAAGERVSEAMAALDRIEDEIHAKRGALQHVGGEVAKQHAADAQAALQVEREREQHTQNEYEAWNLLRTTLLEAEKEEGVHLGRALGGPIAERFALLTQGKYGEMNLGPNLDTPSISAAGAPRDLRALSVGTRDQLSTIFRLTLAEYLHSAVLLDDQLTQTDIDRMAWLRDLIREVTGQIQVVVFTCRPLDYLAPEELHGAALGTAVRAIDLLPVIERAAPDGRRVAATGGA